ncbi:hypothetical protein DACRYDRAFT_118335 [Dacryopinax primogenitus]|uniref:Uncharacterized protein n=1 Tax=Dacryopinax primogenitus (strain DJM 731) TaxID=1858805 RepID=M5FZR1_DACPD|nr:uncharacterized protein DACRYDRAFT_118335 [Dacryopinax primogenitus]EJT99051.1 hypothetical protein DACRYDRAFT_118335 [Dacryopinax primogenitus]
MWSTNTYLPPARGFSDPTKPVPNLPSAQDYKDDDILLFNLLANKPPTIEDLRKYKARDWDKLEHLESFVRMRKSQHVDELSVVHAARAKAFAELERQLFLATPSRDTSDSELLAAVEEEKAREKEVLDRRWRRIEQIVNETYWREVLEKEKKIEQIIADPQPKNYPPVRVPRSWDELKMYPEYMKLDLARLLYRHAENKLFKAQLRDSKWHKDKEVADFDTARDLYKKERVFKEYLERNYKVIRDW